MKSEVHSFSMTWILCLLLCMSSCKQKDRVQYREETAAETADATQAVFANQVAKPDEGIPGDIDRFFEKMGISSRRDAEIDADDFFSIDAMLQALKSGGMLDSLNHQGVRGFEKGFRSASGKFGAAIKQMAFDDHRVLRIEEINTDERLAYVRTYDNELNATAQIRWWLVRTEKGWRIYDYEDLSVGLRTVSLMGTLMSSGMATVPEPWIADFLPIPATMQTIDISDPENLLSLEEPLLKLRKHELPGDVKRFASAFIVSIAQIKGEPQESIEELEAAKSGGYESPLYHYQLGHALMQLEKYGEALEQFGKHAAILGWDSDVLESVSDSHYLVGDLEKARQAALDGLSDNPRSINCLCCLAVASNPAQISGKEFRSHIDKCGDPAAGFEAVFDYTLDSGLLPQSASMLALMDGYLADEDLKSYYREAVADLQDEITE